MWLVVDTPLTASNEGILESRLIKSDSISQVRVETVYKLTNVEGAAAKIAVDPFTNVPEIDFYRVSVLADGEWLKRVEICNDCENGVTSRDRINRVYGALEISLASLLDVRCDRDPRTCERRGVLVKAPFL